MTFDFKALSRQQVNQYKYLRWLASQYAFEA